MDSALRIMMNIEHVCQQIYDRVCVCVREREREREKRGGESKREKESKYIFRSKPNISGVFWLLTIFPLFVSAFCHFVLKFYTFYFEWFSEWFSRCAIAECFIPVCKYSY